jgi:nucleoside-diphosphate-sugar epimerase
MIELAKEIISLTKSSSTIVFKDLPQDDPVDRLPDISKAQKNLKWQPIINRQEGLKKTIEYFQNTIEI